MSQQLLDYERIKNAIEFVKINYKDQPELNQIADFVHLSPYHFQRLFIRWAGVSPKKFLQYITLNKSKERLKTNSNLADVAYDVGLSGTGRLHDLYITIEGMTPNQYKNSGLGLTIYYDFFLSPFGKYLLATTGNNKICTMLFSDDEDMAIKDLYRYWFNSTIIREREMVKHTADLTFDNSKNIPMQLFVKGTIFQIKVWEALLKIPYGSIVSYQAIAEYIKKPKALQAVGSAIGQNPVAYLIPCHRVIRKAGNISEYRWGTTRKSAIIGWEASKVAD